MNTIAIANHLNVAADAIVEVQEWARVLWVRVKGLGARFVSKKVAEVKTMNTFQEMKQRLIQSGIASHPRSSIFYDIQQWVNGSQWQAKIPSAIMAEVNASLNAKTGTQGVFRIRPIFGSIVDFRVSVNGFDFNVDVNAK